MIGSSYDTDLNGFLKSRFPGSESAVGSICIMAFHSIAKVIGKDCHIRHLRYILFQCPPIFLKRRIAGCPSFAINEYRGIDLFELGSYAVHGLRVVDRHQIETETVDMIFLGPIFHGIHDIIGGLFQIRGGFVAATGRI